MKYLYENLTAEETKAVTMAIITAFYALGINKTQQEIDITTTLVIGQIKTKKLGISVNEFIDLCQRGSFNEFGQVRTINANVIFSWCVAYIEEKKSKPNNSEKHLAIAEKSSITNSEKENAILQMARSVFIQYRNYKKIAYTDTSCAIAFDFLTKQGKINISYSEYEVQAKKELLKELEEKTEDNPFFKFLVAKEKQNSPFSKRVENRQKKIALLKAFDNFQNKE